jgi:molybdopterin molybdotransferase
MSDGSPASAGCGHDSPALSVDAARARMLAAVQPVVDTETVALMAAWHRVLAEPVQARANVPGHDNSAMDGYALRAADASAPGARLRVIGESFAGHPYVGTVGVGECVRIMTGAVMPAGADAVVMQERVLREGVAALLQVAVQAGENRRRAGEDLAAGQTVLRAGRRIEAADLGVLASVGAAQVRVFRRLRVAFFSTGDELRPVDAALAPGEIVDSNRYSLHGLLAELGVDAEDLGAYPDDPGVLRRVLQTAGESHDAVISTGGASVGEADYMVDLLAECGAVGFWRVAMKPGRPLAFGRVGRAAYFGLPGNPVSAMVTFLQLVQPALVRLAGGQPAVLLQLSLPLRAALRHSPGRREFQRGRLVEDAAGLGVVPLSHQGSGVLRSMVEADCFIVVDDRRREIPAGECLPVQPFAQPVWQR